MLKFFKRITLFELTLTAVIETGLGRDQESGVVASYALYWIPQYPRKIKQS